MTHVEVWCAVSGFEAAYAVSSFGHVRSEDRPVARKDGTSYRMRGRVLKPRPKDTGHLFVALHYNGVRRSCAVHHLVLEAFVGPRPDGLEALHWDDNPSNNHVDNLRWGTRSENVRDCVRNGRHAQGSKTHCVNGHEFTPENTYRRKYCQGRKCRTCIREQGPSHRRRPGDKLTVAS